LWAGSFYEYGGAGAMMERARNKYTTEELAVLAAWAMKPFWGL
jgi:hypothetical protein